MGFADGEIHGRWIIVEAGVCHVNTKLSNLRLAGAVGILIISDDMKTDEMIGDKLNIPAVLIRRHVAQLLSAHASITSAAELNSFTGSRRVRVRTPANEHGRIQSLLNSGSLDIGKLITAEALAWEDGQHASQA